MSFSNMLKILQEKNKDAIILIKTGIFYIATGKDAVFLNKQLGLKCICFKNQKLQEYIQYMLEIIFKLQRIEKFNIGNEYKVSMYEMLEETIYINKLENRYRLNHLNKIDAKLNCQRIYLRIMVKNKWIDEKKFQVAIAKIAEIGRMVGGIVSYYAKNNTK